MKRINIISVLSFTIIPIMTLRLEGGEGADVLRAKGFNVITINVQTSNKVSDFDLTVSFDGEVFRDCGVGLPRPWQLFYSISQTERDARITVPVVAVLGGGINQFLFEEPGQRWFRWQIRYEGGIAPDTYEQTVIVLPPSQEDLHFLGGLANPELIRTMFGDDFFERQTGEAVTHYTNPEMRAIKVIGNILLDTRQRLPGSAQRETIERGNLAEAGQTLFSLAKELPDSSYAPYAAYYAARCFTLLAGERANEAIRRQSPTEGMYDKHVARRVLPDLLQSDEDAQRAVAAFQFAAEHGDLYLRPLALYHLAGYHVEIAELNEGERLLTEAGAVLPGRGTIEEWSSKLREQINEYRRLNGKTNQPHP